MNQLSDSQLEGTLHKALGTPAAADFDAWLSREGDAVAYLNPIVAATYHRRRRLLVRIVSGAAAAAIFVAVATWFLTPQGSTFAQTINVINKAETITWTIAWYDRMVSHDGKRTWLEKHPRWERSYLAPRTYRDVRYDDDGNISSIDIEDAAAGKVLHLDMKKKTAMVTDKPSGQFGPGNPFGTIVNDLDRASIEYVGRRDIHGVTVNVFRYRKDFPHGGHEIRDIWLDVKTKRLVGYCTTSDDEPFDPATARDRDNPPEPRFSKGTIAGVINSDIVFDAQLDPKLFSLNPPDGFKIIPPKVWPKITEELLVEWLRVTALANGDAFVDADPKAFLHWHTAIAEKAKVDRSKAEQQFLDLAQKHAVEGNHVPMRSFADAFTKPRSFRYLGKSVRLGDGDRIVCFYELESTGKYRAVYGDLTVKDVKPDELPLPVEK